MTVVVVGVGGGGGVGTSSAQALRICSIVLKQYYRHSLCAHTSNEY